MKLIPLPARPRRSLLALLLAVVAGPTIAGAGPGVTPSAISFGELHPDETMAVTLSLSNPGPRALRRVACKGPRWTVAPAKVTIPAGGTVTVVATYRLPKRSRTEGRLELGLACGGSKVALVGTSSGFPAVPPPADPGALATRLIEGGAWLGRVVSPTERRWVEQTCNDPTSGDADTCCTHRLRDVAGNASATVVIASPGCSVPVAVSRADAIKQLTDRLSRGRYLPATDQSWELDAVRLPDGRYLTWHDGAVWVGAHQVGPLASRPTGVSLVAGQPFALITAGAPDRREFTLVELPAP